MKNIQYISLLLLGFVLTLALQAQNPVCYLDTMPSTISTSQVILDMEVDKDGNIYVGGYYHSGIGGNYTGGSYNYLLQKYSPSRQLLWQKRIIPKHSYYISSYLTGLDVDDRGNVYTVGSISARVLELDSFSITVAPGSSSEPNINIFIAKIDSGGTVQWIDHSYDNQNDYAHFTDIQYQNDSSIIASGIRGAQMVFTGGDTLSNTSSDMFLLKVDSDGRFVQSIRPQSYGNFASYSIGNGNPAYWYTKKNFGVRPKIHLTSNNKVVSNIHLYSNTYSDLYIDTCKIEQFEINAYHKLKTNVISIFNEQSHERSFRTYGTDVNYKYRHDLPFAIDRNNDVYLGNEWTIATYLRFDDGTSPPGNEGAMVAKFDLDGNQLWYNQLSKCRLYSIHCSRNDIVYVIGEYTDSLRVESHLGGHQSIQSSTSNGNVFILSMDTQGNILDLTDIHGGFDATYRNAIVTDCGTLYLMVKSNGNTFMGTVGLINSSDNLVVAKYNVLNDCQEANCKFLGLKRCIPTVHNCQYQSIDIEWEAENIPYIDIAYSLDGGQNYTPIINQFPASSGAYSWQPVLSASHLPVSIRVRGSGQDDNWEESIRIKPRLSGDYSVGNNNADFTDFKEAFSELSLVGICSDVTFHVQAGIYADDLTLYAYKGMQDHRVTFRSASGSPDVKITSSQGHMYRLFLEAYGVQNLSFVNIEFENHNDYSRLKLYPSDHDIQLQPSEVLFDSCVFFTNILYSGEKLSMYHNTFKPGLNSKHYQIMGSGAGMYGLDFKKNTVLGDNTLGFMNFGDVNIENNRFTTGAQFTLSNCFDSIHVHRNQVIYTTPRYWVQIWDYSSDSLGYYLIYNNRISSKGSSTLNQGLVMAGYTSHVEVVNNSFKGYGLPFVYATNTNDLFVYNNCFSLSNNQIAMFVELGNLSADYNNYYGGKVGTFGPDTYTYLADWQQASGMELNSHEQDPGYLNDTNLVIRNGLLDDKGFPISYIKTDYEGGFRNPFFPDIGADEFSTASLHLVKDEMELVLYPNPVSQMLHIYFEKVIGGDIQVEVMDLSGKLTGISYSRKVRAEDRIQLNVDALVPGFYLLRIIGAEGVCYRKFERM